jgi:hypothetical protein
VYALVASGQKATLLWLFLTPVALLIDQGIMRPGGGGRAARVTSRPWIRLGIAVVLGIGVAALLFPERFVANYHMYFENFDPTGEGGAVTYSRPASYWRDIARAVSFIGHGTGSASLGLQYVAKLDPRAVISYSVEGGYAAVLWEWGVIGLVFWMWWSVRLLWKLWVVSTKVAGTAYHLFAFSAFLYAFFILIAWFYLGMQPYQNYTTQAYLWFLAGIAFKLPLLARTQAESAASQ